MKKQMVMTVLLLGVSAVLGAGVWFFGTKPLQDKTAELKVQSSETQSGETEEEERVDSVDGKAMVDAAVAKGQAVLSAWETYLPTIDGYSNVESGEEMEEYMAKQRELGEDIRACFTEDADVSLPFYTDASGVGSHWAMMTPYTFDSHGVNCVFLCTSDTGDVLSYVSTYYNAEEDLFTGFIEHATSYGNSQRDVTASEDGKDHSTVTGILEWAEQNNVGPSTVLDEQQEADRADAFTGREDLQEWMREQGYLDDNGLTEEGQKWMEEQNAGASEDGGETE